MNKELVAIAENNNGMTLRSENDERWEILMAAYLDAVDLKDTSRQMYCWALTKYFLWLERTGRILKEATPADIVLFKDYMVKSRLSKMTIGAYITAVRQFYRWTESTLLYPNIARSVKPPRGKKGFLKMHLTADEVTELMSAARLRSLRDYAIVNLIIRTGLRTVEVARADVGDVRRKRGRRILRVWGKGQDDKGEFVILSDLVWNPLKEYLDSRGDVLPGDPLFVTEGRGHKGSRMSPRLIQYLCKELLKKIGLEGHEYSAHSLRHTTAVLILTNGGDWKDVQRVLRHASPATSQIYTASIEDEVRLDSNPEGILDNVI